MESIATVMETLERAPHIVVPLVREMRDEWLKRRPHPDRWSVHEHACHLATVHPLFQGRLKQFVSEEKPVIKPYDPAVDDPDDALIQMDLDEALDGFGRDRAELVARLRGLDDAMWSRAADHGEYDHYDLFIMFRHLALHDLFHAYRIEELVLRKDWS